MTKIEQAAVALERAQRVQEEAFSKASTAREETRRKMRDLRVAVAATRERQAGR